MPQETINRIVVRPDEKKGVVPVRTETVRVIGRSSSGVARTAPIQQEQQQAQEQINKKNKFSEASIKQNEKDLISRGILTKINGKPAREVLAEKVKFSEKAYPLAKRRIEEYNRNQQVSQIIRQSRDIASGRIRNNATLEDIRPPEEDKLRRLASGNFQDIKLPSAKFIKETVKLTGKKVYGIGETVAGGLKEGSSLVASSVEKIAPIRFNAGVYGEARGRYLTATETASKNVRGTQGLIGIGLATTLPFVGPVIEYGFTVGGTAMLGVGSAIENKEMASEGALFLLPKVIGEGKNIIMSKGNSLAETIRLKGEMGKSLTE